MSEGSAACVMALDIGTSSARAMLFDAKGIAIPGMKVQKEYKLRHEPDGAAETDAESLRDLVAGVIDDLLKLAASVGDIAAVGVTTFWHSCLGVDGTGHPVTPLYTWADTRSHKEAQALRRELDPQRVHSRTGCALHTSYYPARLRWIAAEMPETFQKVKRWLSPGEYLFQEFFGAAGCSVSMASATGLFHQQSGDWDEEMLTAVGISRDVLAPLTDTDTPVHGLRGAWAERWKPLANIPWVPAIGDGAASNVGSGCVTDRRIAINIGTSGAIRVLWRQSADKPLVIPDELWCYRLDRERCLMGGAFSDGGAAFAWMRHTLNFADNPLDTSAVGQGIDLTQDAQAEQVLSEREPDSHGLTFLPFLGGERSIGWHPGATAILAGLTQSTSPLEILQATMEAVALRFTLVAEVLTREFPDADEIIAAGGALGKSPLWAQMLADALGRSVQMAHEEEATSRGAALVALRALGILHDEGEASLVVERTVTPDGARHKTYRAALARQQKLYTALFGGNA